MTPIPRSRCAISGADDLERLHSFKQFPVFMGCSTRPDSTDLKADMSWWISRSTGLIQLNPLLPLDVLYPESHGAGSIGSLWARHHEAFARFLQACQPRAVFEIGGSHGILEREYQAFGAVPWTILEPNPAPAEGCRARFIRGFFDEHFRFDGDFDTVVHSHVFEHIYDPGAFMAHLASFMEEGKKLAFSIPNMRVMLERRYTNCINFEHTLLLTEPYVEHLLSRHGFRLERIERFLDDHSIFYSAARDCTVQTVPLPDDLYRTNTALYEQYLSSHSALAAVLNEQIAAAAAPVYLFGAHVFAQYMLAFGLDETRLAGILDNDPQKQGKRLYGSSLTVHSPAILRGQDRPIVILRAGVYNAEIREAIVTDINPDVVFLC
jgi:SAM-dependent methyltransferase